MMGSPLYMSPEQMRSSKDVSAATDIWALGVILHELIAGDVPFTGASVTEVLVKVMQDAPPPLRSLRPNVPEGLEAVVLRCMAKAPAERYPSVAALAVALTPYASPYTLGLQQRLAATLGEAAAAAAAPVRGMTATRVEVERPATASPGFRGEATAVAAPAQTATGWEGEPAAARSAPAWRRRLPWIASGTGLALMALLLWARSREPLPASGAAAATAVAPAAAAAPEPAAPEPAAAPARAPTPVVAPVVPEPAPAAAPPEPVSPAPQAVAPKPAAAPESTRAPRKRPEPSKSRATRAAAAKPEPAAAPQPAPAAPARPRALSIEFK
jgi:serine/threonine-protein kinase